MKKIEYKDSPKLLNSSIESCKARRECFPNSKGKLFQHLNFMISQTIDQLCVKIELKDQTNYLPYTLARNTTERIPAKKGINEKDI